MSKHQNHSTIPINEGYNQDCILTKILSIFVKKCLEDTTINMGVWQYRQQQKAQHEIFNTDDTF